ncbi:MAG TPA: ATP synthase F1 subunit gamma [Candidatus Hydrogenedens sp.]|nr:ATP synthase F1 subunit gamma [Candidatus Hydrogenedens sp.]HOK08681.1 ATP synthase F1 subunit gamma [Candidatus Hydrogenedens sp.]HOL21012.1 ATP synthase F1 subunit gamma [Candidatus Hydrogenedens sp.]HPP58278.1 ATP synthase F1 subunit gamma [Candidatus Hydrogenedens sp.]
MSSIQEIRSRIKTIKNTQKITKAIKMIATVRLKKAQNNLLISRVLPSKLEMVWNILNQLPEFSPTHPLLIQKTPANKIGLLVITSDHGLCGGFNTRIIQKTKEVLNTTFKNNTVQIISIGNKGKEALKYQKIPIHHSFENFFETYSLDKVSSLVHTLSQHILSNELDCIFVIYTKLGLSYNTIVELERILPLPIEQISKKDTKTTKNVWIFEPNIEDIIQKVCEMFLLSELHRIFQESLACEQLARMQAMELATKNADETLQNLTLVFNKTRQELITKEMLEVISGVESLE